MRPIKHAERGLTIIAGGIFNAIQSVNKYKPNPSFTPKWSDKPLLKSWQKSKPTLGWPRTTDSLCPNCVIEAREAILSFCRANLAPYKIPKEIFLVDALPLTSVGKIDKKALRADIAARLGAG